MLGRKGAAALVGRGGDADWRKWWRWWMGVLTTRVVGIYRRQVGEEVATRWGKEAATRWVGGIGSDTCGGRHQR